MKWHCNLINCLAEYSKYEFVEVRITDDSEVSPKTKNPVTKNGIPISLKTLEK